MSKRVRTPVLQKLNINDWEFSIASDFFLAEVHEFHRQAESLACLCEGPIGSIPLTHDLYTLLSASDEFIDWRDVTAILHEVATGFPFEYNLVSMPAVRATLRWARQRAHLYPSPPNTVCIPFGKYEGTMLADVPLKYLESTALKFDGIIRVYVERILTSSIAAVSISTWQSSKGMTLAGLSSNIKDQFDKLSRDTWNWEEAAHILGSTSS